MVVMAGSALRRLRRERLSALADPEVAERAMLAVVEKISGGGTYEEVCAEHGLSWTEMLMWLQESPERWNAFLKAHEARALHFVSETVGIADDKDLDPADKKVRIDTRFRLAKHHAPGLYGEKEDQKGVTVNVTVQRFSDERVAVTVENGAG